MVAVTRITHVITRLDVGGAQTHVVELALGQRAAGHTVDVVAGVAGAASARLEQAGVPVAIVTELGESRRRVSPRAAVGAVTAAVAAQPPDVLHGHSSHAGLAARLAGRKVGCATVYTAHGWPFQKGAAWSQRIASFGGELVGGRLGDAVIVLTEAERARAVRARVAPVDRLYVVPNGIADVGPAGLRIGGRTGPPTLVMVARFAPPKLQAELIRVLAGLTDLAWTLRFVGDGPDLAASRAEQARHPELAGRIEFTGHRDDVTDLLVAADVGVLWSRYEGLPISVMEYMRAGLCCVASDLPGTRELLADGAGELAATPGDLAATLRRLLTDPERRDTLARLARARYEAAYSVDALVSGVDAVYRAVLDRRLTTG